MTIYCVDIDNTLFTTNNADYAASKPIEHRISTVNRLYREGNTIKLFTARGSTTGQDWRSLTEKQLKEFNVLYHELILGKPEGDIFIDDKAKNDYLLDVGHKSRFNKNVSELIESAKVLLSQDFQDNYSALINKASSSLMNGGKIIFAGNGGSFSDALHISGELICKLRLSRKAYSSIVLGANPAATTAWSNDISYLTFLERELSSCMNKNDLFIALSTSGKSSNILNCLKFAKSKNYSSVLITGKECHESPATLTINIDSMRTERIQELTVLTLHSMCEDLEELIQ